MHTCKSVFSNPILCQTDLLLVLTLCILTEILSDAKAWTDEEEKKASAGRISRFTILSVIFKQHCGSERVKKKIDIQE